MKKIICSVFLGIIALSLFGMSVSANPIVVFDREYGVRNFKVVSNDYSWADFYNTYNYIVTDYAAYEFNGSGQYKVGYDVYLYENGRDVIKQMKDFNLPTNASGYFSLGFVGQGEANIRIRAYNYDNVQYIGWTGTQRFLTRTW